MTDTNKLQLELAAAQQAILKLEEQQNKAESSIASLRKQGDDLREQQDVFISAAETLKDDIVRAAENFEVPSASSSRFKTLKWKKVALYGVNVSFALLGLALAFQANLLLYAQNQIVQVQSHAEIVGAHIAVAQQMVQVATLIDPLLSDVPAKPEDKVVHEHVLKSHLTNRIAILSHTLSPYRRIDVARESNLALEDLPLPPTVTENQLSLERALLFIGLVTKGVNVGRGYLPGATFESSDLRGMNLKDMDLSGASLAGSDLSGAYLAGANFTGTHLENADLTDADLVGANFTGVFLNGANINGVKHPPTGFVELAQEQDAIGEPSSSK